MDEKRGAVWSMKNANYPADPTRRQEAAVQEAFLKVETPVVYW